MKYKVEFRTEELFTKEYYAHIVLRDRCVKWLADNLSINSYELHFSEVWNDPNGYILFKYEEDLLVFKLRFGL